MATDPTSSRPTPVAPLDLAVRAVLVVAAAVTAGAGAPGYAAAPLTGVAALLTLDRVARRDDRPLLDSVVRGAGGLVLALIALGFALNVVPHGLTRTSWSVGAAVLALIALAGTARRTPAKRPELTGWARGGIAYVATAAILGLAFTVTVRATDHSERGPLALSVQSSDADSAEVAINGGTSSGSYELLVDNGMTSPVLQGPIAVAAGSSVEHSVSLPAGDRITISLVTTGSTEPLRTLVLQGAGPLRTAAPVTTTPTTPTTQPPQTPQPTPSSPAPTTTPTTPSGPAPTTTPTPVLGRAKPLPTAPVVAPTTR